MSSAMANNGVCVGDVNCFSVGVVNCFSVSTTASALAWASAWALAVASASALAAVCRGNVLSAPNVVNAIAMEALKTLMCALHNKFWRLITYSFLLHAKE